MVISQNGRKIEISLTIFQVFVFKPFFISFLGKFTKPTNFIDLALFKRCSKNTTYSCEFIINREIKKIYSFF